MNKKLLFILILVVLAVGAAFVSLRTGSNNVSMTTACPSKDIPRKFTLNVEGLSNEKMLDQRAQLLDTPFTVRYPSVGYFGVPMRVYREPARGSGVELILNENINDVLGCAYSGLLVYVQKEPVLQTLQELALAAHASNQELQYDVNNPVQTVSGIMYVTGTSPSDAGIVYHRALGIKNGYSIFVSFQHNGTLVGGESSEAAVFRTILETIIFE